MSIDVSMFGIRDAAQIGLQRTSFLRGKVAFKLWAKGRPEALMLEAAFRRRSIINGAFEACEEEFNVISKALGDTPVASAVDIGCGHGLFDLLLFRKYACSLHLVDIENTASHHHGFKNSGSGYANLSSARKFLECNGVPASKIMTTNPNKVSLNAEPSDLIISLLSCGFHYPLSTYLSYFLNSIRPGGRLVFDMRKKTDQEKDLAAFSSYFCCEETSKYRRIVATR